MGLIPIVAHGLGGTTFDAFRAEGDLLGRHRLAMNIRMGVLIMATENARGGRDAKLAIDTLVVDVVLADDVLWIASVENCHGKLGLSQFMSHSKVPPTTAPGLSTRLQP